MGLTRRSFVAGATVVAGSQLLGAPFWQRIFATGPAKPGPGPYGPLQAADANDLELPAGFTSRLIGRTGDPVVGTTYTWHGAPDGGGCFATADGGWIYVSNAELGDATGGVSAVRFGSTGEVVDAYSILSGTNRNCSGGVTPWGTWLSCEESGLTGEVFECDPQEPGQGVLRPLLGKFNHEAAAVDPTTSEVYLTEDSPTGRLYKFVPSTFGDLSAGQLFAAVVTPGSVGGPDGADGALDGGTVSWVPTSSDEPDRQPGTAAFDGGEGVYLGDGVLYFATKGDRRIWEIDTTTSVLSVAYDCLAQPSGDLDAVDAVVVHTPTQRVFVAEDGGNMEVGVMSLRGDAREVAAFCRFVGHEDSEVAGTAFSPDGTRLYLSSQRGTDGSTGVTIEITGPFDRPFGDTPPPPPPPAPAEPVIVPFTESAFVRGGTFADTTFASAWLDQVCNNTSDQYARRTYLRTDTAAVVGSVARAIVWINARMWTGNPSPMELLAVDAGWSAAVLTFNNRPTPEPVALRQFTVEDTTATWYAIDVTDRVAAERAAGRTAVAFVVAQTERNGRLAYVYSPSSDNAPYLELTIEDPGAPSTTTSTSTTSTTTTSTTSPTTTSTTSPTTSTTTSTTTTSTSTTSTTTTSTTLATAGVPVTLRIPAGTYVRGGTSADRNFAGAYLHQVCNNSSEQYARETYLALPASELRGLGEAAKVELQLWARMWAGGPSAMTVSLATADWNPQSMTWSSRPAPGRWSPTGFTIAGSDDAAYDIDVTASVRAALAEGASTITFIVRQADRNGRLTYIHTAARPTQFPRLRYTPA